MVSANLEFASTPKPADLFLTVFFGLYILPFRGQASSKLSPLPPAPEHSSAQSVLLGKKAVFDRPSLSGDRALGICRFVSGNRMTPGCRILVRPATLSFRNCVAHVSICCSSVARFGGTAISVRARSIQLAIGFAVCVTADLPALRRGGGFVIVPLRQSRRIEDIFVRRGPGRRDYSATRCRDLSERVDAAL
jgi:hypothetical protein